jgi:hypothetical protein
MHSHLDLTIHPIFFSTSGSISQDNMQVLNKTKFAFFFTMAMLVGSGSSAHATPLKLRQTKADTIKPVGPTDGINKKRSMKNLSAQPSTFPSTMPSAQPTQKKSGKGMMSINPGNPSY